LAIDRIDVSGLDVAQVVKLVVGVEGTVVRLDIRTAPPVYGVSARGEGASSSPVEELV
jgi:C-terminal processing protease CtpA/Prc